MALHLALEIGKTGLQALQKKTEVNADNLANISTNGFKSTSAKFADLPSYKIKQPGSQTEGDARMPSGLMIGTGVKIVATEKNFRQGAEIQSENALDLSINGGGFFQIQRADGTLAYTRNGSFSLDANGNIVNSSGLALVPNIAVPNNAVKISISAQGVVAAQLPGEVAEQEIGTITLATFINKGGLEPIGDNLYIQTAASGEAIVEQPSPGSAVGEIRQYTLEGSNVSMVDEMVKTIENQRAHEVNVNMLKNVDETLRATIQALG